MPGHVRNAGPDHGVGTARAFPSLPLARRAAWAILGSAAGLAPVAPAISAEQELTGVFVDAEAGFCAGKSMNRVTDDAVYIGDGFFHNFGIRCRLLVQLRGPNVPEVLQVDQCYLGSDFLGSHTVVIMNNDQNDPDSYTLLMGRGRYFIRHCPAS